MKVQFQFAVIFLQVLSIYKSSIKLQRAHAFLVAGQLIYAILGFFVVPMLLFYKNLGPRFGDYLSNPKIFVGQGFEKNMQIMNFQVMFGLLIFHLYILSASRNSKENDISTSKSQFPHFPNLSLFAICSIIIFGLLAAVLDASVFNFRPLTWLASTPMASVAFYALFIEQRETGGIAKVRYYFITLGSGFFLSLLTTSKTPIIFILFVLFLNRDQMSSISEKNYLRISVSKFIRTSPIILIGVIAFLKIQTLKQNSEANFVDEQVGRAYFGNFYFFYTILKRFDGFRSLIDVNNSVAQDWLTPGHLPAVILKSIDWNYGTNSANFGQLWNINLIGRGYDGINGGVASLSQSPIAEGYLLFGYAGIALHIVLWCLLTKYVSNFATSGLFKKLFCLQVISTGSLFENGVIANLETFSNSVKITIILYCIFRLLQHSQDASPEFKENFHVQNYRGRV